MSADAHVQRQRATISKSDAQTAALSTAHLGHDRRRPMHVIEHQMSWCERTLPSRLRRGTTLVRTLLCDGRSWPSLSPRPGTGPAPVHLIARQAVLQCRFDSPLQGRVDGRANRVRTARHQIDISSCPGLTAHLIHEIKTRNRVRAAPTLPCCGTDAEAWRIWSALSHHPPAFASAHTRSGPERDPDDDRG